jgi:S-adenosylmethionine decarboxylase
MQGGLEWILDVRDCAPKGLAGEAGEQNLRQLFEDLIQHLELHPVAPASWHRFPGPGGVTGLVALSESHLACHSYPEAGYLSLNLYTCRARPEPDWQALLEAHLGPCCVQVRHVERGPAVVLRRQEQIHPRVPREPREPRKAAQ